MDKFLFTLIMALLLFIAALAVPYRTYHQTIERKDITANYLFAADIEIKGERTGASSELCCYILFHPEVKAYPVIVKEYVFYTTRNLDTDSESLAVGGRTSETASY